MSFGKTTSGLNTISTSNVKNTKILLPPADIVVGISQILPVLALALAFQQGVLAIEQPELHIHPALQVALGDLFIEEINSDNNINGGKIFLLETHSDHLMLRFLKSSCGLIRQKLNIPKGLFTP